MSVDDNVDELEEARARYASILKTVSRIRGRLEQLAEELETGNNVDRKAIEEQLRELPKTIANCHKAELTLNEYRNKEAGIAQGGYALDIEKIQHEIDCKLARLGCPYTGKELFGGSD